VNASRNLAGARRPCWEAVHATGVPFLQKTLRLLGVAERDLEDVLQDDLLAALRAWERFEPGRYMRPAPTDDDEGDDVELIDASAALARLRPRMAASPLLNWLFGIAWRQVSHYKERAHRRREVLVGLHVPPEPGRIDLQQSPEDQLAAAEQAELAEAALWRMDLERRAVLVLHDMVGIGVPTIAAELGVNPNTAHNRLRLAREEFRAEVRYMGEEMRRALQLDERMPLPGTPPVQRRSAA
jgi:RNA polymerase sigma-70 factor (ECF subfamily)